MRDTALFQKVEGHKARPPLLELVRFSVFLHLAVRVRTRAFPHLDATLLSGH